MIAIRSADQRGVANFGWLDSRHTFSFGHYYDPEHMGFGPLRVINEDKVQPGQGFATHGHSDMEIISYVLDGALEHKDSMGTGSIIKPGDVQRMSAGTGVRHSEYNASKTDPVHFLQIWIIPERKGLEPSYEQTIASLQLLAMVCRLAGRVRSKSSLMRRPSFCCSIWRSCRATSLSIGWSRCGFGRTCSVLQRKAKCPAPLEARPVFGLVVTRIGTTDGLPKR